MWATVRRSALHLGYPGAPLRLSLAAYAWPPYITLANATTEGLYASRGIGAGSTFAVHELMATMLVDVQGLQERWPLLAFHIHVDDIQMVGAHDTAVSAADATAEAWADVVATAQSWQLGLAVAKQATVATDSATQRRVAQHLQRWAGGQSRAGVLGYGLAFRPAVANPPTRRTRGWSRPLAGSASSRA